MRIPSSLPLLTCAIGLLAAPPDRSVMGDRPAAPMPRPVIVRPQPATVAPAPARADGRSLPGRRRVDGQAEPRRIDLEAVPRPRALPEPEVPYARWPRALPRLGHRPGEREWRSRDIMAEIQMMARRGAIPVSAAPAGASFSGQSWFPAGWCAYSFVVPPGEKLHVRLRHDNEGWFRLAMVDRWGQARVQGMLQNLIPTGNPEVTFENRFERHFDVYVIVDDPGWMSAYGSPFTLEVQRSWDPARTDGLQLPTTVGIWAKHQPIPVEPEEPGR